MAITDIVKQTGKDAVGELSPLNIIEFAESKEGLNLTLYPMQRLILKLFYRLPLSTDINENKIIIRDEFNDVILHEFCERDCLDFLYNKRYCNLSYYDIYIDKVPFRNAQLYIGRRGTKTMLTTIISAYTIYELLFYHDPHSLFHNKPLVSEIAITLVSNHTRGSSRQYRELTGAIAKSKFFRPYIGGDSKEGFWLKTKAFIELQNRGMTTSSQRGNIRISSSAANYGIRGDSNIAGVLDEFCIYADSEVSEKDNPIDRAVYEALAPSTFEYVDNNGRRWGKMFILSSPNGKKGEGYRMYEESFTAKNSLMLNMPSPFVNTRLDPLELRAMSETNRASFEQEILAMFNSRISHWIENGKLILAASDKNRPNQAGYGINLKHTYYMGIDFALDGDGTAVAIAHSEPKVPKSYAPIEPGLEKLLATSGDIYVVDYIYLIQPEPGKTLDIEGLVKKIARLVKQYNVQKGYYDQWSKGTIEKFLKQAGLNSVLECLTATIRSNNDLASVYKQLTREGRIITPNDKETFPEYSSDWNMTYLDEVFQLVEYKKAGGMIKVENPSGHDDRYKAVEKAVYLAYTKQIPTVRQLYSDNPAAFDIENRCVASLTTKNAGALPQARGMNIGHNFIKNRDLNKRI